VSGPESPAGDGLLGAVRATVTRHRLLDRGDRVVVAVSGGADSVALLHALVALRDELALELVVCHVHHGLRAAADQDAAFVRDLAARLDCPATVARVSVPRDGRSPEEAARAVRHAALGRAAREAGAARIALGHTADDQAETVLMRLLQGAGPRGLAGIPVRRGLLVRPLLHVDRATVLAYLAAHGIRWVEDHTNRDPKLLRNRIRHDLLPLVEAHGWPRVRVALCRTARASRETVEALDALLAPRLADAARPWVGGVLLPLPPLRDLPAGAVKALLGRVLGPLRAPHLDGLHALVEGPVGARVRLPGGIAVERGRDALWVSRPAPPAGPVPLAVPGETEVPGYRLRLEAWIGAGADVAAGAAWEARFDAAALAGRLRVRAGRPGDRVVVPGAPRPRRVAAVLAAAGVAPGARRDWPILVAAAPEGETVLWVIGVHRAAGAPVTAETRAVLSVRAVPAPWSPAPEEPA
jgi:tRNA(Ile)-lysidine synthase